jgi:hypothetical protein
MEEETTSPKETIKTWSEFEKAIVALWEEARPPNDIFVLEERLKDICKSYYDNADDDIEVRLRHRHLLILDYEYSELLWHARSQLNEYVNKARNITRENLLEVEEAERKANERRLRERYENYYPQHGILEAITRLPRKDCIKMAFLTIDGFEYPIFNLRKIKNAKDGDEIFFSLRRTEKGEYIDELDIIHHKEAPTATKERKKQGSSEVISSPLQRKLKKAAMGVVTEQSLNYLVSNRCGMEQCGLVGLSTKGKWILDCIVDNIVKDESFKTDPSIYLFSHSEFVQLVGSEEIIRDVALWFTLTDDNVRRITGRTDLRGWEIEELFREVRRKANVEGRWKVFYDEGHWHEIQLDGSLISDLLEPKTCGIATRRKNISEKHREKKAYTFRLGTIAGLYILSNLAKGKFKVFPKDFYKMKFGSQEIYRYISSFEGDRRGVNLTYRGLSTLLGLKEYTSIPYKRTQQFKVYLEEICKVMGLSYKVKGRGEKTVFSITKQAPQLTS